MRVRWVLRLLVVTLVPPASRQTTVPAHFSLLTCSW